MSPAEMREACENSLRWSRELGREDTDASVSLVLPKGFKPPPKFPRGYLLQVKDDGSTLKSFPAVKLISWLTWAETLQ